MKNEVISIKDAFEVQKKLEELRLIKQRLTGMLHQGEIERDQYNYILGIKKRR